MKELYQIFSVKTFTFFQILGRRGRGKASAEPAPGPIL